MAARRVLAAGAAALTAAGAGGYGLVRLGMPDNPLPPAPWADPSVSAPPRREQLAALRSGVEFDLLIIGGGATGTGAALDAATRGLRVALVEGEDFASGTSSRSTKLVHGGVRYLEKAVFQLDYGQLKLVFEALKERRVLLKNAPHLARALPIATPCYDAWEVPYYWAGMKAYDLVAGLGGLTASRFATASQSTRSFPTLAREFGAASGDPEPSRKLLGTIVYEDGQFDDARLATALATTAGAAGATVVNYARVTKLLKDPASGRVIGAKVRDVVDGETRSSGGGEFEVRAKCVLNATGPFSDGVRSMSDATRAPIVTPAGGTHVTLPAYFAPKEMEKQVMKILANSPRLSLGSFFYHMGGTRQACAKFMANEGIPFFVWFLEFAGHVAIYKEGMAKYADALIAGVPPPPTPPSKKPAVVAVLFAIAAFAGALYLSSFDAPPELPPPREKFLGIF